MTTRAEYFAPASQRLNLRLLEAARVVIVGVGMVGSPVANALAQSAIGHLRLIDGDQLEDRNLHRHFLKSEHLGWNKAQGMADVLKTIPGLHVEAVPHYITPDMPDDVVDASLRDADVIIAATDRRAVQRRISTRARVLDIPALFPGIYANGGAEVFLQRSWLFPCYMCWDGWRSDREQLREAGIVNDTILAPVGLTTSLARSILDPADEGAPLLDRPQDIQGSPQLYVLNQHALGIKDVERRPNCPVCAGGPAALRASTSVPSSPYRSVTRPPPPNPPPSPAPSRPSRTFDFSDWLSGCIFGSVVMLVPGIWVASWLSFIFTGDGDFSIKLWLIVSVILGIAINTVMAIRES